MVYTADYCKYKQKQFYLNYDYIHIFFICHSTSQYLLILPKQLFFFIHYFLFH